MISRTLVARFIGLASALALVATATVTASVAASAPAQAATTYTTHLTVNAKPEPVARTKQLTVTGTLKYTKGGKQRPMANKVLTVHFDPTGPEKSKKVRTIRTNSAGSYTHRGTAWRSGTWTVKYTSKTGSYRSDRAADAVCVYTKGRWQCPVSSTNRDLDCKDIRRTVWVGNKDYHRLDADNDGWGCDSY